MASLGLNATNYHVGLKRADSAGKAFASNVKGYFLRAFSAAAIVAFSAKIINAADEITDLSERLSMSTDKLQEWIYAAKKSGATAETLTGFFENLAIARAKALGGDPAAIRAMERFGIDSMMMARNNPDEMGRQIGKTIQGGNARDLLPDLRLLGGRGAGALIPAFKEGIDSLAESAKKMGAVWDVSVLLKLKEIKKELLGLSDAGKNVGAQGLGTFGLPAVQMATDFNKLFTRSIVNAILELKRGGGIQKALIDARESTQAERNAANQALWEQRKIKLGLTDSIAPSRGSFFAKGGPGESSTDRLHSVERMTGMRMIFPTGEKPQLNDWQRLGLGAIRGAEDNSLKMVEVNTRKTADTLESIKRLNSGSLGAQAIF